MNFIFFDAIATSSIYQQKFNYCLLVDVQKHFKHKSNKEY